MCIVEMIVRPEYEMCSPRHLEKGRPFLRAKILHLNGSDSIRTLCWRGEPLVGVNKSEQLRMNLGGS